MPTTPTTPSPTPTTPKKQRGRPSKRLANLPTNTTNGELAPNPAQPTTLDAFWGNDGRGKYSFLKDPFSDTEYASYIKDLSESAFGDHCRGFGILFSDRRAIVEKKLIAEFCLHRSQYKGQTNAPETQKNYSDEKSANAAFVKKFMAGGK